MCAYILYNWNILFTVDIKIQSMYLFIADLVRINRYKTFFSGTHTLNSNKYV